MILTGKLLANDLKALDDFKPFYDSYSIDNNALLPLIDNQSPLDIVVIVGTWCPDCHREIAHFIRIMEALEPADINVTYLGVDRLKQDPENLSQDYQFERIPTFIVTQAGKELGRIVESPTLSLEKDLVKILTI
ncbi:thioredoxin family protein [uncultured Shewanella sp.]|uniref:TlpA family protein disulfide reductase n=1 Tax=uncultured Shewanella sp. TaxID=173975 RepID=UPI0026393383|nr:thioredoxin family protein [uncultured Shewanella sp.]